MKLEDMPRQVCFHAQQASEKAIKSIFVFLQTEFPYTHDLDRLRGLLPEGWLAEEELPDLSGLTFWLFTYSFIPETKGRSLEDIATSTD